MKKPRQVKNPSIAVIGTGCWGKNLVRNYHEMGALKLICDKDESLLEPIQKQYPESEVCLAFNEVISRDDTQALVIATPAKTHFSLAREAIPSEKHVYMEKPLVLEDEEEGELIRTGKFTNKTTYTQRLL
jgi:UDP-2-acetamido-3-amino-2,3-dideoxy-glucuronate N-acetyltransferase